MESSTTLDARQYTKEQKELCKNAAGALSGFKEQCKFLKIEKGLPDIPRNSVTLSEKDLNKLRALGYL